MKKHFCDACSGIGCDNQCYYKAYNKFGVKISDIPKIGYGDGTCCFNGYLPCDGCNSCDLTVAYIKDVD